MAQRGADLARGGERSHLPTSPAGVAVAGSRRGPRVDALSRQTALIEPTEIVAWAPRAAPARPIRVGDVLGVRCAAPWRSPSPPRPERGFPWRGRRARRARTSAEGLRAVDGVHGQPSRVRACPSESGALRASSLAMSVERTPSTTGEKAVLVGRELDPLPGRLRSLG